ncbi:putative mitochondrial ribosomal protein of the small subunit [Cutaneotrichosporon oleaginosum]|uniref:Putative mitochondrial ribosomal protein of the small subunit n=1 Tax=Cutaneotrichosporon oleaginosum TaxID=879819 RepID=A0A0J1AVR3_9TREE|nr:putative mitochondrial ribosomal protein of the small subunit [Cutaneotrichosporon oleaginosum]KLT39374.1 putative mitochondrial ribosomal protein of the small subunit [Cutaneotrichosporon oleaginosum]TXT12081.1 hypothetical protein COLE_02491 [Cutaneotrichosporon oleaginosum]
MNAPPHKLISHLNNVSRNLRGQTALPYSRASLGVAGALLRHGLISNVTLGTPTHPNPTEFHQLSPPAQRVWVNFKHRNGLPVMRRIKLVSKSSIRKFVSREELGRILLGKETRNIHGAGTGEVFVVKVPADRSLNRKGADIYMEGWEAYRAGLGGEVICRAS